MSSIQKLTLLALLVASLFVLAISRDLPPRLASPKEQDFHLETLEARLAVGLGSSKDDSTDGGGGGLLDCWNALMQLRSCTNEIVLFFLNGEAYLSLDCCQAIHVITQHCWASMLGSLGFTAQEGDVLRGYCDAEAAPPYSGLPLPSNVELISPVSAAVSQGRFL